MTGEGGGIGSQQTQPAGGGAEAASWRLVGDGQEVARGREAVRWGRVADLPWRATSSSRDPFTVEVQASPATASLYLNLCLAWWEL